MRSSSVRRTTFDTEMTVIESKMEIMKGAEEQRIGGDAKKMMKNRKRGWGGGSTREEGGKLWTRFSFILQKNGLDITVTCKKCFRQYHEY
jgi:hypothetical protein